LARVTKDIRPEYEKPFINRWDRRRTVTIQAMPAWWSTYPDLKNHADHVCGVGAPLHFFPGEVTGQGLSEMKNED
jgi:hypothetical protein